MAKRSIPTNIEKLLVSNEPFEYAHLVKFERPFDPKDGVFRNNEKRYVYLTDGPRDVEYHGITYVANRLVTVGGYSETTEARATNMSLTLAGEPVGLTYTVTAALSSSGSVGTLTGNTNTNVDGHVIDFVEAGFIEGDAVKVEKANGTAFSDGDTSKVFVIKQFTNENRTFTFERTGDDDDDSAFITLSNTSLKLTLDSAEIKGPLNDSGSTAPSFLNREVFIYKVFFDADNPSAFVGGGTESTDRVLVFKGIISSTNIQEAPTSSKVQWNLTSHWGDFEQVAGRITTDEIHRALDSMGRSNRLAALKPEYSRDLGFLHAESSLNTIATYQTSETRYKYKTKKKWFKSKVKEQPYEHITDHDVDLSVYLSGKYLPVLYGVNRVPGVPIFADTSNTNAKEVYVAYAISEGENHGLYNLYIDGAPLICVDKSDFDVRSTGAVDSDSQALQCYGRMDQGATLGGQHNSGTTTTMDDCEDILDRIADARGPASEAAYEAYAVCMENSYEAVTEPTNAIVADDNAFGVQHNQYAQISHPYDMRLGFHSGRANQAADNMLVTKAANNGFKRQNDYYSGTERYWGPDHRLLDTSYAVFKFTIDADTTTVPEVEYVVKGKVLENYNYDGTFIPDAVLGASDNHANFKEGDSVTVEVSSNGSSWTALSGTFRILDKYNFETARGTSHYRFRLNNVPDLSYEDGVPTKKYVRLKSGSNYWHMITYNNNLVETANWSTVASDNTISASSIAVVNNRLEFTLDNTNESKLQAFYPNISSTGTTSRATVQFSGSGITGDFADLETSTRQPLLNTSTNKVTINNLNYNGSATPSNINLTPATVFDFSDISAVASVTNTAEVVGCMLEIIETGEEREITAFNTSTNFVTIESPFVTPPKSGHTFRVKGRGSDKRSSINPAIQTADILTSKLYGKGLIMGDDIALNTVKTAALLCDTRSDVTLTTASAVTVKQGDIYKITKGDGTHLASGRVESDVTNGTQIKFDEVSGKFLRGYQNYINYNVGDIIYHTVAGSQRYYRVTSGGYKNTAPSHTSGTANGLQYMSTPVLTKVSGNGSSPASITLTNNGTIPLYSLFDSDFVKYWRYLGWEENRQWCVTRHQTNGMMDTAKSVFSNLNGLLSQYNGILSYSNGKYELSVETNEVAPTSSNSFDSTTYDWNVNPEFIDASDIIGTVNLNDNSQKNSKNTVKGSIFDPQNNFQSRSITFYNSDFLKADRNVIKTGNMTLPAVSSYYNARMTIEKYLLESRFSKEISFTIGQKGLLLKPGQVISLNYEPFGFSQKLFRISNLNYQSNCTVSIKATEYDDSFYVITPQKASKAQQATLSQREGVSYPGVPALGNPTTTKPGIITLSWTNGAGFTEATDSTQIWRASSQGSSGNVTDHATLVTTVDNTTSWADAVGEAGTFYYWIRHVRKIRRKSDNATQLIFKEEFSTAIGAGKQGVAKVPSPQLDVDVSSIQIKFNDSGALTPTGTAQDVKLTATLRNITADSNGVQFSIIDADQTSQTDVQFTNGSTTLDDTSAPYEATVDASSASNATTNKFVKATVTDTSGETFTQLVPISITKDGSSGSTGVAAAAIDLSPSTSVITYSANDPDSENPATTISFTTTLQGNTGDATSAFSGTPYYEFIVDGTTKQNSTTSTFTLADTDEPADQETVQVQVKARDGGTTGAIKATDAVTIFGIKSGSDAVTAFLTNTAHTVSAGTDGTLASGALTNAGGTFKVFVGSTDRTTSCNFSEVSGEETSGLTSSINASTGVYTISALTVDLAKNVFRATIPASISPTGVQMTIDQTYSIAKSRNGLVGSNGTDAKTVKLTSDKYAIAYNAAGSSPNPSSAFNLTASTQGFTDPYFKFTGDGITNETSFTDGNNSGAIDPSDTFSFTPPSSFFSTPKILKVEVVEAADTGTILASDSIAIYAVQPGAAGTDGDDAFTVICTNESHAIPADADGANPVMTGSGTTFQVFKGNTQLTGITSGTPSATQFKVTVNSDTNITVGSQSASSNNIVFADHSSLTADTADIIYTVNVASSQSVTKKQTFSRTNKGVKGDDGDQGDAGLKIKEMELYYAIASWTFGSNATWPSTPSTGTYNFGTDVLSSIPSGWSRTKESGVGKIYSVSRALVTESSSGSGVSGTISWNTPTLSDSGFGDVNYIFQYNNGQPSTPAGTSYPNLPSGWSDDIPSAVSGQQLYSSKGVAKISGSGTSFQFNYTWGTPVLHVTDKADIALGNVDNESSATIRGGNITGTIGGVANTTIRDGVDRARTAIDSNDRIIADIYDGSATFSPVQLLKVKGGFDDIDSTPVLKVANANSGLKNASIGINTSTGVISGIGTGTNSRVFNDVIGISMATSGGNQGRITIAGVGASNTTVDVTKSNLGLNYSDGATVGAQIGTNLLDSGGTGLNDADVRNDDLQIDYSGTTVRLKKGASTVINTQGAPDALKNETISIDTDGILTGIGTADIKVNNAKTTYTELNGAKPPSDANKVDISSGTDGKISVAVNGGTAGNINVYSTTEKQKINRLQAGQDPDDANKSIKNSGITITNTGILSGIGTADIKVNNAKTTYTELNGTKPPSDANKVDVTAGTDGRVQVAVNGAVASSVNVFSNADRQKLTNLRAGKVPGDGSGNTTDSILNAETDYSELQGTKPPSDANKVDISSGTDGKISVAVNGATADNINVYSTTEKQKINRLQAGQDPDDASKSIKNSGITITNTGILSGIGTESVKVNNAKITTKADGTLNYDGTAAATPSLASIAGVVSKQGGGFGTDVSSAEGVVDFSSGTPNFRTSLPKTRGGFGEDISNKTGVLDFSSGTANFRTTLPTSRGGFGLDVGTLFGTTVGRLPRWNGTTFVSAAETDFKNDEIIDTNGNIKDSIGIALPGTTDVFSPTEFKNVRGSFENIGANTIKLAATKVPLNTSFLEVDSGNIKIKNDAITGDQLNDNITYAGTITAGSGANAAHLDGTGTIRIYAGSTTGNKASAPFRVTQSGGLTATSTTLGSTSGVALSVSTGTKTVQINTPSDTSGTVFQAGGDASSSYVPLKVLGNGSGVIRGFDIFTSDGTKVFDKTTGLTNEAITVVAQATGSAVSTISKTTNSETSSDAQKITNGSSAQTVTVKLSKDGDGMIGFDSTSSGALADIPSQIVVKLFKSANANLSSPTQIGSTRTLNRTTSSSSIGTNTYFVNVETESEPGFNFSFATLPSSNSSSASSTPFDASGNIILEATDTLSANQVVYYFTQITGTNGNGAGSNNITSAATRSITVTAASGNTFTIDESGDSTGSGAEGDITAVVAANGLTGGATSGSASLSVGQGDGISVAADAVAVDSTVIRTTGNQTLGGTKTFSSDVSLGNGTGSIGEEGGDSLFIQGGTTSGSGLLFHGTGGKVLPLRNSNSVDATIDLGQSSRRFKNLYLSGNIDVDGIIDNTYNNGNVASPSNSDHTAGTRIKFYDASTTAWYAMGIESNTLWFNSDNKYKWYEDSTIRMTLDGANLTVTGTISTGSFTLPNSIGSAGQVLKVPSSGTTLEWASDNSGSGGGGLPSGMTYSSSILDVTGTIRATADVIAYHSSDYRLKDNVKQIENAMDKVSQIRGVEFDWNDKQVVHEGRDIGVIAQEVEKVAPEIVATRDTGYKAVNYQKLTALLIEAVKELQEEIKELKKDKST